MNVPIGNGQTFEMTPMRLFMTIASGAFAIAAYLAIDKLDSIEHASMRTADKMDTIVEKIGKLDVQANVNANWNAQQDSRLDRHDQVLSVRTYNLPAQQ